MDSLGENKSRSYGLVRIADMSDAGENYSDYGTIAACPCSLRAKHGCNVGHCWVGVAASRCVLVKNRMSAALRVVFETRHISYETANMDRHEAIFNTSITVRA
jgi:hypothetical protein